MDFDEKIKIDFYLTDKPNNSRLILENIDELVQIFLSLYYLVSILKASTITFGINHKIFFNKFLFYRQISYLPLFQHIILSKIIIQIKYLITLNSLTYYWIIEKQNKIM